MCQKSLICCPSVRPDLLVGGLVLGWSQWSQVVRWQRGTHVLASSSDQALIRCSLPDCSLPSPIPPSPSDVDFDDWWVWKAILEAGKYNPRVVIVEVSAFSRGSQAGRQHGVEKGCPCQRAAPSLFAAAHHHTPAPLPR